MKSIFNFFKKSSEPKIDEAAAREAVENQTAAKEELKATMPNVAMPLPPKMENITPPPPPNFNKNSATNNMAEALPAMAAAPVETSTADELQSAFSEISAKIQAALDEGAATLAKAEAQTEAVAKSDPNSPDYKNMVEEVKALQAKAGAAFKRAEEMISATNKLLPQKE